MKLFHKLVQPRRYNFCSHSFVCLNFFTIFMMMMAMIMAMMMVMAMMIRRRRWCQNFLYNLRSYCTHLFRHDIAYHGWQGDTKHRTMYWSLQIERLMHCGLIELDQKRLHKAWNNMQQPLLVRDAFKGVLVNSWNELWRFAYYIRLPLQMSTFLHAPYMLIIWLQRAVVSSWHDLTTDQLHISLFHTYFLYICPIYAYLPQNRI